MSVDLKPEGNMKVNKNAGLANALCSKLLDHMLTCDACLDGSLDGKVVECPTYAHLQEQIAGHGGATALVFAY